MSREWDRRSALVRVAPVLTRYLSSSAAVASGLPGWNSEHIAVSALRRVVASHLAVQADRDGILDKAESLVRGMPASVQRHQTTLHGTVRGPTDWNATIRARVSACDPTLFVCEPVDRRYDTDLGRLLKATLNALVDLRVVSQLPVHGRKLRGVATVGEIVQLVSSRAAHLAANPKLRQVRHIDAIIMRNVPSLIDRHTSVGPLARFLDRYIGAMRTVSKAAVSDVLAHELFYPESAATLFELEVGMKLMDGLVEDGFVVDEPLSVIPSGSAPFGVLRLRHHRILLWWQRSAWARLNQASAGRWNQVLVENGIAPRRPLIPDFLVELPGAHLLLVEVKLTEGHSDSSRERDALRDLLAYTADLASVSSPMSVQGLGVAWNASGKWKSPSQDLLVASQNSVGDAIRAIVGNWIASHESRINGSPSGVHRS